MSFSCKLEVMEGYELSDEICISNEIRIIFQINKVFKRT